MRAILPLISSPPWTLLLLHLLPASPPECPTQLTRLLLLQSFALSASPALPHQALRVFNEPSCTQILPVQSCCAGFLHVCLCALFSAQSFRQPKHFGLGQPSPRFTVLWCILCTGHKAFYTPHVKLINKLLEMLAPYLRRQDSNYPSRPANQRHFAKSCLQDLLQFASSLANNAWSWETAIVVDVFVVGEVTLVLHNRHYWMLLFAVPKSWKIDHDRKKKSCFIWCDICIAF